MAKLIIDLPREWEARVDIKDGKQRIEIEPSFVSGSALAPCLYLTAQGNGGLARRMVLMLNGNTGWAEARKVKGVSACDFDLTPEEYERKRGSNSEDSDDE